MCETLTLTLLLMSFARLLLAPCCGISESDEVALISQSVFAISVQDISRQEVQIYKLYSALTVCICIKAEYLDSNPVLQS